MSEDLSAFEGWSEADLEAFRSVDWNAVSNVDTWKEVVRERFPGWAWALDHEELAPVLEEAAEGDFTRETFESRLRATEWFSSRSASERAWDLRAEDPANAADVDREITERAGEVRDLASQLGAGLSDDEVRALATDALRRGLSVDEITGQIVAKTSSFSAGSITAAEETIGAMAGAQLVSIDAETRRSLAAKVATGEMNEDGLRSYVSSVAKSQYPQFAEFIDQGISIREYTAPQRNLVASMLGRSPADVDLTGEFRDVLSIGDGGSVRAMSLSETERYVRTKDDYWREPAGQQELHGMVNGLTRALGARR